MTTYYVDPIDGSDSADGRTPRTAWRTFARAEAQNYGPGDALRPRRGATLTSGRGLRLIAQGTESAPVVVDAYGAGALPLLVLDCGGQLAPRTGLDLGGSFLVVNNLRVTAANVGRNPAYPVTGGDMLGAKYGYLLGAAFVGDHLTVQGCEFHNLGGAFFMDDASHDCQFVECHVHDMDVLWKLGGEPFIMGGMFGIMRGLDNVAAGCLYERSGVAAIVNGVVATYSGMDMFNANGCKLLRNVWRDSRKFVELGKDAAHTSAGNEIAYNVVTSDVARARGPNVHGPNAFGPVTGTHIHHNTIALTGDGAEALTASVAVDSHDNALAAPKGKAAYYDQAGEHHNLYRGPVQFRTGRKSDTSRQVDNFGLDADYRPQAASPCNFAGASGDTIGALAYEPPPVDVAALQAERDRLVADAQLLRGAWDEAQAAASAAMFERDRLAGVVDGVRALVTA